MTLFETDIGVALQWQLLDKGAVVDLSVLTVTSIHLLVNGLATFSLTVADAVNGMVEYITKAGDFPRGQYSANIELALANPVRVFTTKTFQIISKPLYG